MAEQEQKMYRSEDCAVSSNSAAVTATATLLAAPGSGWRLGITSAALRVKTPEASDDVTIEDEDGNFDCATVATDTEGTECVRTWDPRSPLLLPENKALKATSTMATGVVIASATAIKIKV